MTSLRWVSGQSCAGGIVGGIFSGAGLISSGALLFGGVTTPGGIIGFEASVYGATVSYAEVAQKCF